MEKSSVGKSDNPAAVRIWFARLIHPVAADRILQLSREYDKGDTVKIGLLENGIRRAKTMEVVQVELRGGKWVYQLKPSGGEQALQRDENGNDWFTEDKLEWG